MLFLELCLLAPLLLIMFFQDLFEFDEVDLEDVIEDAALNCSIKLRSLGRERSELEELANTQEELLLTDPEIIVLLSLGLFI